MAHTPHTQMQFKDYNKIKRTQTSFSSISRYPKFKKEEDNVSRTKKHPLCLLNLIEVCPLSLGEGGGMDEYSWKVVHTHVFVWRPEGQSFLQSLPPCFGVRGLSLGPRAYLIRCWTVGKLQGGTCLHFPGTGISREGITTSGFLARVLGFRLRPSVLRGKHLIS